MMALAALVAGLWLAVAISVPRAPHGLNETAWLVYSRHAGAHARLALAAFLLTLALVVGGILSLATAADSDLERLRNPCDDTATAQFRGGGLACWRLMPDGTWRREIT